MKMLHFPKGIHQYIIEGNEYYAEYMGRQNGFECSVCGKGCNAFTFNILHGSTYEEAVENYKNDDYETWGYGRQHIEEAVTLIAFIDAR